MNTTFSIRFWDTTIRADTSTSTHWKVLLPKLSSRVGGGFAGIQCGGNFAPYKDFANVPGSRNNRNLTLSPTLSESKRNTQCSGQRKEYRMAWPQFGQRDFEKRARDDKRTWAAERGRMIWVTYLLIALNIFLWFYQLDARHGASHLHQLAATQISV